jgi:glycerol-3-phosphate responsive antiterminator
MAGNLNSGRKSKSDEIELIERLGVLDDEAFEQLRKGIERGEFAFIKLYFLYKWGRPKNIQEITVNSEQPLFNLN